MLQYKIPQDVELADKILGPLTLKQLLIIAAGGGIAYSLFLILSSSFYLSIFDYFWIAIPLFISLAFAFLRINDVSFLKWLLLLFEFNHNARRRRWDKTETSRLHFAFVSAKTSSPEKKVTKKLKSTMPGKKKFSSLEEITYLLDHSSNFSAADQVVPNDHDAEHALHLSDSEKNRQETRLEQSIAAISAPPPVEKMTAPVKIMPEKSTTTVLPTPAPTSSQQETGTVPTTPVATNEKKAVDMVLTPKNTAEHTISFPDLQQGGQVSFS